MTSVAGVPVPAVGFGTSVGGVKRGGRPIGSLGFRGRPFVGGSVLGYLGGVLVGSLLPLRVRALDV